MRILQVAFLLLFNYLDSLPKLYKYGIDRERKLWKRLVSLLSGVVNLRKDMEVRLFLTASQHMPVRMR